MDTKTLSKWTHLRKLMLSGMMLCALCSSASYAAIPGSKFVNPQAQDAKARKITGSIVSRNDGQPLIGVSVLNQKTGQGTITDIDGKFTIDAYAGNTLKFSYVGYTDLLVEVGSADEINVSLEENSTLLNETVVVGFATQKKVNLTGAVGVVGKEEINGRPVSSAAQALQGLDPSMNIALNSGRADSGYSIDIRGVASLNGGTPLILVDGVESSLNRLNPNDIESISILKDAASASVYGAKASAGVVLISTKGGADSKVRVNYNGRFALQNNTTPTDWITNGYEWGKVVDQFFYYSQNAKTYLKYNEDDWKEIEARRNDKTENPERPWVVTDSKGNFKYYGNFDWYGYFFKRTRTQQEHNVSITGGNDKVKYYISGRVYDTQGMFRIQNDPYTSYSVRGKFDFNLAKWARLRTNVGYFNSKMTWPGLKNYQKTFWYVTFGGSPLFVPVHPDGSILNNTLVTNQKASVCGDQSLMLTYNKATNTESVNETTIKNELEIDIVRGLMLHLNHAYSYYHSFGQYRSTNAPYSTTEGITSWATTKNFLNTLEETNMSQYKHTAEAYADYSHTWGGAHNFKVMAGVQYDTRYYRSNDVTTDGCLSEDLNDFNVTAGQTYTVKGGQSRYQTLGVFGRINYDYKGRYLFELSGRADGSSRFLKENRWGFFPSGSLGWRMSEENFWKPIRHWWSNAKIRFSVGSLGNQQVSDYLFVQTINTSKTDGSFTFNAGDKLSYAREDDPVSSSLTWETVTTYDVGADLNFFDNRLSVTGDWYIRDTKNMMMPGASLPNVYGAAEPKTNAADMRTKGWEISIGWRDVKNVGRHTLAYGIRGTLGDYQTEVTRYDNDTRLISDHYVGEKLGEIWGFSVGGLFRTDEEASNYAQTVDCSYLTKLIDGTSTRKGLHAGDVKYLDTDGNGKISIGKNTVDEPGDMKIIGNSTPRFSYTFGGDLSWNGIDFSILFQGIGKRDWYPGATGYSNVFWGPYCRPHNTFLSQQLIDQIWSEDNPDGYFPFPRGYQAYDGKNTLTTPNDRYIQKVSYLRLKNLSVGYSIPVLRKHIQQIRIYFAGENLAYWSPLKKHCKYQDPDAIFSSTSHLSSGDGYNIARTFSFGIDLTF